MLNTIMDFLITMVVIIAAMVIVYAGFKFAVAAGEVTKISRARELIQNTLVGLILLLTAWLLIDTIMKVLVDTDSQLGVWHEIECRSQPRPSGPSGNVDFPDNRISPSGQVNVDGQMYRPSQVPPQDMGLTSEREPAPEGTPLSDEPAAATGNLTEYAGYKFDESVVGNVQELAERHGLRVSSGHRTEAHNERVGGAENSYHLTGRAADFVGTEAQMQAAAADARASGASEVLIHNVGSGRHLHVAW
jgi:hypothetical protein